MNKSGQQGMAHIVLLFFVILVLAVVGFIGWRVWDVEDDESDVTISETGEFKRENGALLPDVRMHNLEAVKLPDGTVRAYFHEGPGGVQSAISKDGGQTFTLEAGTRLRGSVPATVQLADGRWRTYYTSGEGLLSAVSTDGLTYTEEPGVRIPKGSPGDLDAFGITHPSIVKLTDGYRMYYDGQFKQEQGPYWRIMSASSQDGLTWTKDEGSRIPVDTHFGEFETELSFSSHVQYKDSRYIMYFSAQGSPLSASGIWRATSSNGLDFEVEERPVLARDPQFGNEEDSETIGGPKGVPQDPFLLETSAGERLYYWTSDKGYRSAIRN